MLYGNGTTRLETYSRSVGDSETDTWKFLRTKAKNCNTSVFEAGYYFLVDKFGASAVDSILTTNPNAGYLAVLASPDNQVASDAHLYVKNISDTMYTPKSLVELCKTVELTQEVLITDTTITVKDASNITTSTFLKIDNELMYITSILGKVLTVNRAILDTVPTQHIYGTKGLIFSKPNILNNLYGNTNNIDVKVITNVEGNLLSLSTASVSNVDFDSRAIRPYPPANVKINGEYWPEEIAGDLTLTWVDRNRIQQTGGAPLGFFDSAITVEDGVTYNAEIYDAQSNIKFAEKIALASNVATFEKTELSPVLTRVDLYSMRSGFESYQKYQHIFSWGDPPETFITAFTASGTFIVPARVYELDVLIVAGGGGGGCRQGGGGGAGGLIAKKILVEPFATINIAVGHGGAGGLNGGSGSDGQNSSFGSVSATGGGGGGGRTINKQGRVGGSGGGGGGGGASGGSGAVSQGNSGGASTSALSDGNAGGGGGGAGQAGISASGLNTTGVGGSGGAGVYFSALSEFGDMGWFAGGGGGGVARDSPGAIAGRGGKGGGGDGAGATLISEPGKSGAPNTGGGGGGSNSADTSGAAGGSGIVVLATAGTFL